MIANLKAIQNHSLVYRHILLYRAVVSLLFFGRYKQRFKQVISLLNPIRDRTVTELCFGDIYIAKWCKEHGVQYLGIDVNPHFVDWAQGKGYQVMLADLREYPALPKSDVVVIMGSLYHFHDILGELVEWVMASSRRLIITEPIKNWSSREDILGYIARRSANAGRGHEDFRYNDNSLHKAIEEVSKTLYDFDYSVSGKEAIIELRWKDVSEMTS